MKRTDKDPYEDDSDVKIADPKDSRSRIFPLLKLGSSPFNERGKSNGRPRGLKPGFSAHQNDLRTDSYWDSHGLLWCAFSLAAGIAVYRVLPEEPNWIVLLVMLGVSALLVLWPGRAHSRGKTAILFLVFTFGLAVSASRTAYLDAPRLGEAMNATLEGHVVKQDARSLGRRIWLDVRSVNEMEIGETDFPERVRIRIPSESPVRVGDYIQVRARLFPPAGPVSPGGYDFSFRAYFLTIGATGFSYGPPSVLSGPNGSWTLAVSSQVQTLRTHLAGRIKAVLEGHPQSGLAVALLVGDRSGISEAQERDLRAAGLAHILAISGLHMALFAGGAYGVVLLMLALIPPLTLRWPVHKWAALAALLAATFYLVLSGASVATQRSFLMVALVFLGVLVGRRALTLRSVALAALVLLVLAPERLFFPGFQMSFAAVICLVAVYKSWRDRQGQGEKKPAQDRTWGVRLIVKALKWGIGLFVTALVAGLATGIIGAHHFGRIAPFGLLGNMLGMPVFTLLVMPMGVLALLLMPLGLASLPLSIMSFGLSLLMKIAAFTASVAQGAGLTGNIAAIPTVLLMAALFSVLLFSGRLRLFAGLPLAASMIILFLDRPPDIQIASSGGRIAARDANGKLMLSSGRQSFVSSIWLQWEGVDDQAIKSRKMKSDQMKCDAHGCVAIAYAQVDDDETANHDGIQFRIALPKSAEALEFDCRYADLIVSDLIVSKDCGAGLVLDQYVRARRGAVSIWLSEVRPINQQSSKNNSDNFGTNSLNNGIDAAASDLPPKGKAVITRLKYAIPDPPRPWHEKGTVTRASLKEATKTKN